MRGGSGGSGLPCRHTAPSSARCPGHTLKEGVGSYQGGGSESGFVSVLETVGKRVG